MLRALGYARRLRGHAEASIAVARAVQCSLPLALQSFSIEKPRPQLVELLLVDVELRALEQSRGLV